MVEIVSEDGKTYTMGEILKYVANTEGAHADTGTEKRSGKKKDAGKLENIGSVEDITYILWCSQ